MALGHGCSCSHNGVKGDGGDGADMTAPPRAIAATALHHGLTIATRDTRDYLRAGVPVLNPWKSAASGTA